MEDQDPEILKLIREAYTKNSNDSDHSSDNNTTVCGDVLRTKPLTAKKPSTHDLFPISNLEAQIIRLKHSMENWREIVLPIHSILLWEKNWHPGAIIGGTTFLFLSLWLLDPSVLTTVSILGLTATISDYLVPSLASTLFKAESWNSAKEKAYCDFCSAVIVYKAKIALSCSSFYVMRSSRPKMFYGCTILTLALLAWIGNSFNNLFLTYLLVTVVFLIPGMEHHGILHKYGNALTQKISECTKMKSAQLKKEQ